MQKRPARYDPQRAHQATMEKLEHMHRHQLEILERMRTIMSAIEDLTREVEETKTAVLAALAEMQRRIDEIIANPADTAAVADAAAKLDELQTQITAILNPAP